MDALYNLMISIEALVQMLPNVNLQSICVEMKQYCTHVVISKSQILDKMQNCRSRTPLPKHTLLNRLHILARKQLSTSNVSSWNNLTGEFVGDIAWGYHFSRCHTHIPRSHFKRLPASFVLGLVATATKSCLLYRHLSKMILLCTNRINMEDMYVPNNYHLSFPSTPSVINAPVL